MTPSIANVVVHVSDIDRAVHFYRDGLGLGVRFDSGDRSDPVMLGLTDSPPTTSMRIVVLELAGGAGLTLARMDSTPAQPPRYELGGFVHVGLRVDDIHAVLRRAVECGGVGFGTPAEIGPPGRTSLLAFLRDPDGSVVELVQPSAPPAAAPPHPRPQPQPEVAP